MEMIYEIDMNGNGTANFQEFEALAIDIGMLKGKKGVR